MSEKFVRERRKMFKNLADHCHDKAIEQVSPHLAARWIFLADALLWAAFGDGDGLDAEVHCQAPHD